MVDDLLFQYRPICSASGCERQAIFKIAANWSDGTSQELKSYGLVCEPHLWEQLDLARGRSAILGRAEEETVGPVEIFRLEAGRRDAELARVSRDSD